jgi:heme/copper-type cytochrome/quinol oxidase subunit 2
MLMGIRSIATLYLIDAPLNVFAVIKAYGRQWYWQFEVTETRSNLLLSKYDIADFDLGSFTVNKTELNEIELTETFVGTVSFFDSYMLNYDESCDLDYSVGTGDLIRNLSVDVPLSVYMGLPLRFLTTAMDVLHSFAVPSLGIKMDAVPGRLNSCDVVIEREGIYYGQCSELCGQGHGFMPVSLYSCQPVVYFSASSRFFDLDELPFDDDFDLDFLMSLELLAEFMDDDDLDSDLSMSLELLNEFMDDDKNKK